MWTQTDRQQGYSRTLFVRYKNNKFLTRKLLEICYFYILQTKPSLDKIFYKIVYHYIIYMCKFFY